MSLHTIDGRIVYVVEFDTLPQLPITGEGVEAPYATALTAALEAGLVTEPGKYGIEVTIEDGQHIYNVYHINE